MADIASLEFTVDTSDVQKASVHLGNMSDAAKKAARSTDMVGNKMDRNTGRFAKMKTAALNLKNQLLGVRGAMLGIATGAAAFAIGRFAQNSVRQFAEFEQGLLGVSKTTDITGDALDTLGNRISTLSTKIPVTTNELLNTAQAAGQLGVEGSDNILNFASTVTKLGTAADVAGEEAALALARIMEVTGESMDRVDEFASVIVRLGNNFAATESEILRVTNEVARSTTEFSLASDQVAAIGATMATFGARAEGAGTAIGRAFREIQSAIQEGGDAFDRLQELTGLTADQLRQEFAEDALGVLMRFLQGVRDSTQSTTAVLDEFNLGTAESAKALGPLVARLDTLKRAHESSSDEIKNATALNEEFERASQSLKAELQLLRNTFGVLQRAVGEELADDVRDLSERLRDILEDEDQVRRLANAFDTLANSLLTIADVGVKALNVLDRIAESRVFSPTRNITDPGKEMQRRIEDVRRQIREIRATLIEAQEGGFMQGLREQFDFLSGPQSVEELRNKLFGLSQELNVLLSAQRSMNEEWEVTDTRTEALVSDIAYMVDVVHRLQNPLSATGGLWRGYADAMEDANEEGDKFSGMTARQVRNLDVASRKLEEATRQFEDLKSANADARRELVDIGAAMEDDTRRMALMNHELERGRMSTESFFQNYGFGQERISFPIQPPDPDAMDALRETGVQVQTLGERLDIARQRQQALARAFRETDMGRETYIQASQEIQRMSGFLDKAEDDVSEFAIKAKRNIQDELGDTLLATMRGTTDGILDAWKRMIERMIAEAAAANLAETLFGKGQGFGGGAAGDLWNWAGSLLGGGGGGVSPESTYVNTTMDQLSPSFVGGFQTGGSFTVPGSGGPDSQLLTMRATPGEQVTVTPSNESGQPVINQTINVNGGSASGETAAMVRTAAKQGAEQGYQRVLQDVRRGGPIRKSMQ